MSELMAAASAAGVEDVAALATAVENFTYGRHYGHHHQGPVASTATTAPTSSTSENGSTLYGSNGSLVSVSTTSTLTSNTGAENFVMPEDVIKYGKMRKLKNGTRRFFVLRRNHPVEKSHISLSYYDSEKKFRANPDSSSQAPRRTILLKHVWNVHHKFDAKHRFVMAIYTREEMFATICDDEESLNSWIKTIRGQLAQMGQFFSRPFREFEHIWQVTIARSGLGLTRNIHGLHRLALANSVLYIFKVDPSTDTPDIYEFPLNIVRKCGHNTSTFFFELGRSSLVGTGTLWLHTEDQSVAQQIHDVVLISMSAGSLITPSGAVIPLPNHPSNNTHSSSSSHVRKRNSDLQDSSGSSSINFSMSSGGVLPRSNSINSNANGQPAQQKTGQQQAQAHAGNHRPRSCSEVSKCTTGAQSVVFNGSSGSINSGQPVAGGGSSQSRSCSNSRRNSKTLQSPPQLPNLVTCANGANCTCSLSPAAHQGFAVHDHCGCGGAGGGYHHQLAHFSPAMVPYGHYPHICYHLPPNCAATAAGHRGGGGQSPANSRERLHSGSWSRTTSECSNEDGGGAGGGGCGGALHSNSSGGAATPVGYCCLYHFNAVSSAGHSPGCSCQPMSQRSSSSRCSSHTSSMDCIDATTVLQFEHQHLHDGHANSSTGIFHHLDSSSGTTRNSIVNAISEEVDDQYYQMMSPGVGAGGSGGGDQCSSSKSNSSQSISSMCSNKSATGSQCCHHHHQPSHVHQVQTTTSSDRGPQRGFHQPKHHHSHHSHIYSGFSPLPTLPAGTDADYLPMTPLSQQKKEDEEGGEKAEKEADKDKAESSSTEATTTTTSKEQTSTNEAASTITTPTTTTTTTSTTPAAAATPSDQPDSTENNESTANSSTTIPKEEGSSSSSGGGTPMDEGDDDGGYLDMTPSTESMSKMAISTTTTATATASTSASSITTSSSPSCSTTNMEQKLEKVTSYYGGDQQQQQQQQPQESSSTKDDSFLTRAYSMGSRPEPLAPSIAAQCTTPGSTAMAVQQPHPHHSQHHPHHPHLVHQQQGQGQSAGAGVVDPRTRAFSMGSHGLSMSQHAFRNANRLQMRRHNQQQQSGRQQVAPSSSSTSVEGCEPMMITAAGGSSSSSSSLAEIEEGCCLESTGELDQHQHHNHHHHLPQVPEFCCLSSKAVSSASAPILSHLQQVRARSATLGARPNLHGVVGGGGCGSQCLKGSGGLFCAHPHHHLAHQHQQQQLQFLHQQQQQQQQQAEEEEEEEPEGDLMEMDFTGKEGPNQKTRSAFEEEIREAKKVSSRNRKNSFGGSEAVFAAVLRSGGSTSLDGSTAVRPSTKTSTTTSAAATSSTTVASSAATNQPGRKRADSTSAISISSFFGPARPSGHHVTFRTGSSTFDNFVSTFRQSLNLAAASSSSTSTSESKQADSSSKTGAAAAPAATTTTSTELLKQKKSSTSSAEAIEEDEPNYMMTDAPQSTVTSSSKAADTVSSSSGSAGSKAPPPTPTSKKVVVTSSSEQSLTNKVSSSCEPPPQPPEPLPPKSIIRKSKADSYVPPMVPAKSSTPAPPPAVPPCPHHHHHPTSPMEDEQEYTLMAPNVVINRPALKERIPNKHPKPPSPEPASTAPASAPINLETITTLTRKMEESARQQKMLQQQQQQLLQLQRQKKQQQQKQAEKPVYSVHHRYEGSGEEDSPYVMMNPNQKHQQSSAEDKSSAGVSNSNSNSGRKSAPNSTTSNVQKKQKTSALRSLVSSLGSKTAFSFASSSSNSNANADSTSGSRKKSSTFSGRLLLNRSNSGQQQNDDSKRKKGSSKSESSSGGSPPGGPPLSSPSNCSTDHATATTTSSTTSVNSMSALAS